MQAGKVIDLEEFRRKKRHPLLNMKAAIESHLAEAGIFRLTEGDSWQCLDGNYESRPDHEEREGAGLSTCEPGQGE